MEMLLANIKRDRRLRRRLLASMQGARHFAKGGLTGRTLRDVVDASMPDGQGTEDDDHALALLRNLAAKGLATEETLPRRRGQRFGLDYVFFRITAAGSSLLEESAPVDPDIDDERVMGNDE